MVFGLRGRYICHQQEGKRARLPAQRAPSATRSRSAWLSTFRGRVGYARDNWLLYATGGGALGQCRRTIGSVPPATISEQQWHWGWTAGGGVEVKLTPGLVGEGRISLRRAAGQVLLQSGSQSGLSEQSALEPRTITSSASASTTSCPGTFWTVSSSRDARSTQTGTWSDGFSQPRTCLSTPRGKQPVRGLRAKAADGRCGCRRSSARRRPDSPRT